MGASDEQWVEKRSGEDRRTSETEDAFLSTLGKIRDEVRAARKDVEGANKRSGWAALFAAVAVVAVLGVAVLAFGLASTVHQQKVDRSNARLAACLQANNEREQFRRTFADTIGIIRQPNATPDIKARTEAFIAVYIGQVARSLPDRDCSPAGIERYYKPTTTTTVVGG